MNIIKLEKYPETFVSLAIVGLILLMVLPVSATVLDFFLVLSFMFSVAIMLICVSSKRVLDFSIFPSVLLLATLFRLALNVASTRLILGNGHTSSSAAGQIIETFGEVIIQNNYFVGIIIFLILVAINFIVITKGAGRVSEVAARFTLDALPGKQAAIESDLRSENITPSEAQEKRDDLDQQADFYGAMDGASKFVRGDAIAGILITFINILGGIVVGVFQKGLSFSNAAQNYTLMTVGDGLVSQVPALMVSTAAGIVITRASSSKKALSGEFGRQIKEHRHVLVPLSFVLAAVGLFLTEAKLPFFLLAILCFWAGRLKNREENLEESLQKEKCAHTAEPLQLAQRKEVLIESDWVPCIQQEESLSVELSASVMSLWRKNQDFMEKANCLRKNIIQEMGCFVPPIRFVDNLKLPIGTVRMLMGSQELFRLRVYPKRILAIRAQRALDPEVMGIGMNSSLLGVKGVWIQEKEKSGFSAKEYFFTDASSVVFAHVEFVLRERLAHFFNYEELKILLEVVSREDPRLSSYFSDSSKGALLLKALKELLSEGIKIADMKRIMCVLQVILESAPERFSFGTVYEQLREGISDLTVTSLMEKHGIKQAKFFSENVSRELSEAALIHNDLLETMKKEILAHNTTMRGMWVLPAKHRKCVASYFKTMFRNIVFISDREFVGAHTGMQPNLRGAVNE